MQSTGKLESQPAGGTPCESVPATSAPKPLYISVKDTAELLGVKRLTVYRRFHAEVFPGRRIGRKIDIFRPFVDAAMAEIRSGRHVDVDQFAASWNDSRLAVAS